MSPSTLRLLAAGMVLATVACAGPDPTQTVEPETTVPVEVSETSVPVVPDSSVPVEMPDPNEWSDPMEGFASATLSIEGSTLVMVGDLDDGFYERFLDVVRGREDEITTLSVNSGGGITDEGREFGHWIFDHGIDVVVDGLCFSSCANYVFTAGKNKTILADSIVGWHGSEQQDEHIARGLGLTVEEFLGKLYEESAAGWGETPSPEGRQAYVEHILSDNPRAIRDEQAFLDKIGVSSDALIYGFLPDQFEGYYVNATADIDGWTFSIEDMASFGIDNVTYGGEGEYPSDLAKAEYGVVVLNVR